LTETLYERVSGGSLASVDMVYSRTTAAGGIDIERRSLLPLDYGQFRRPIAPRVPLTNLAPALLLERLVSEYIYAQLCQVAMLAFEAVNEARMRAMGATRTNIENRLAALRQREQQCRQQEITAEILELATGAEALTKGR
jgi:F-type H+-transporting ATPase subunit gamma